VLVDTKALVMEYSMLWQYKDIAVLFYDVMAHPHMRLEWY
jgi:hypothetical protein